MTKYIFVTGGVVSGLGKGITAASLGRLLKARGLKVAAQKLDPYINVVTLEYLWPGEFPLYFADGVDDLPFMDLKDFAAFMNYVWVNMAADYQITADANPDTGIVMCTRENGCTTVFN